MNLGYENHISQLNEPLIGNPPYSIYNGNRISQDIFNSLLEYLSIVSACPMNEVSSIIEIGAGYGRTAFCFLTFHPGKKYIIVDFPPALYVSQEYLSKVFPKKTVMKYKPFENFSEVSEEFQNADLVFLMPDQINKIPNESAEFFLAIDCLHEMKKERVDFYFDQAQRISKYFYYKCWINTYVAPDEVYHLKDTYPVKPNWQQLFMTDCEIPSGFFHAMHKIK